jgi:hypothetical protein
MTEKTIYRQTTIGRGLTLTLDQMMEERLLTTDLALKVLHQFEKALLNTLATMDYGSEKAAIKGDCVTYKNSNFNVKDAEIRLNSREVVRADYLKIITYSKD